jgi:hypothetical protein
LKDFSIKLLTLPKNENGDIMKSKTLFIFIVFFILQFTDFVHGAIPATERVALIALYNSTNGSSWADNSGWKTPPLHTDGFAMPGTEGSWNGVTVESDHVIDIELSGNRLIGTIPSQLGNLSHLINLALRNNQLSGTIPSQLGNLSHLIDLQLHYNQLSGSIPSELGNLGNLECFHLRNNQLSGTIPSQLGNLSKLTCIALEDNQLSGSIPAQLGNLSKLEYIWMSDNQLSGTIPSQLGKLSRLIHLHLFNNQLIGSIPVELGNLGNLESFNLRNNQLSGTIPSQLGNLCKLKILRLQVNQLSGSIPTQLGNLSNLEKFDLCNNQLIGTIPSSLTNLIKVDYLDISHNCLFATDHVLREWLVSKQQDWEAYQDQCDGILPERDPPFGVFETPIDNSNVAGSIPVTGWALDDRGLKSVKIYLLQGTTAAYIGDAIFVEGARPDVAALYPDYPNNTKAGWGYMMLTHFFPGMGNGTYILSAVATDQMGKTTVLGTTTIHVDNAHSAKPFGAIDTPTQGGPATGKSFLNWGWVLTPQPNTIPTNGSTINVQVNSVNIGHPTYNNYRTDIAILFPGYANSNGAVGFLYLDTTIYTSGVHTIQWTVTDSAGNTDGIGSRYFTIQNCSSDTAQSAAFSEKRMTIQQIATLQEGCSEPIRFKKGFHSDAVYQELLLDQNWNNQFCIKELERIMSNWASIMKIFRAI